MTFILEIKNDFTVFAAKNGKIILHSRMKVT